jgi:hypothetical protein
VFVFCNKKNHVLLSGDFWTLQNLFGVFVFIPATMFTSKNEPVFAVPVSSETHLI